MEGTVSMFVQTHKRWIVLACLVGAVGCSATKTPKPTAVKSSATVPTATQPDVSKPDVSKPSGTFVRSTPTKGIRAKFVSAAKRGLKVLPASARQNSRSTEDSARVVGLASASEPESALTDQARLANRISKDAMMDTMELSDVAQEQLGSSLDETASYDPTARSGNSGLIAGNIDDTYRPRDANSLPSDFRIISESEMLSIALERSPVLRTLGVRILDNPEAVATVYDTAISQSDPFFGPDAALAEFDQVLSGSLTTQNNDRVFNNATLGGQVQELTQDLVNINAGVQRRTLSGATWDISTTTVYDNNNRTGNTFRNYWETQFELGVRQPLLQGAGKEFNSIAGPNAQPGFNFSNGIVIARLNGKISQHDFELSVAAYVMELYQAYWELVRQYSTYQSVLASRELSYETWQAIRAKGLAELEGGEANKEAQSRAKYYNYRRQVQVALGGDSGRSGLYQAERQLRQLIGLPAADGQLLKPADAPVSARFVFDFDDLAARAMTGRVELRRQSVKINQERLRLLAAKNFLLPQLDLISRYRLRGFGDDLIADGPRFSSALDDFASLDHQEWEFGLEMGVVRGRRQAFAAVRNAKLQLSRERAVLTEQQRAIRHQISNAYAEVASSYYAMESSMKQVEATRERLRASEALFKADKIQIEFLLDAQEELLRTELQLAIDQSRYTLSLVAINNTSGTLLQDIGIAINHSCCGSNVSYMHDSLASVNSTAILNQQGVIYPGRNTPTDIHSWQGEVEQELPSPIPSSPIPSSPVPGSPIPGSPVPSSPIPSSPIPSSPIPGPVPEVIDVDEQDLPPLPSESPSGGEPSKRKMYPMPDLPELPKLPEPDILEASRGNRIPTLQSPDISTAPIPRPAKQAKPTAKKSKSSFSRFVSGMIPKSKFRGSAKSVPTQKPRLLTIPKLTTLPPIRTGH